MYAERAATKQRVVPGLASPSWLASGARPASLQQHPALVVPTHAWVPGARSLSQSPWRSKNHQAAASKAGVAAPAGEILEWAGLAKWRRQHIDQGMGWGPKGPSADLRAPKADQYDEVQLAGSLVECAVQVLTTACPYGKAAITHRAWVAYKTGTIPLKPASYPQEEVHITSITTHSQSTPDSPTGTQPEQAQALPTWGLIGPQGAPRPHPALPVPPDRPSRPQRPQLVVPKQVPSFERGESPMSTMGAHMLHNLAHIELNAIDLAMDTVARFAGLPLPAQFYEDFAHVADDEARHLGWCLQRLAELGHEYGDMPAHDLLWEGAQLSAGQLTARLAVVPMSQEARGLDAGQRLVGRLVGAGDKRSASIVARISDEERAHVAVGVTWLRAVAGAQAEGVFRGHLSSLSPDLLKGPFHHALRQEVGLSRSFYDVNLWPAEAKAAIMPPAQAAALRGRGQKLEAAGGEGSSSGSSFSSPQGSGQAQAGQGQPEGQAQGQAGNEQAEAGDAALLAALRQRLETMVEREEAAASQ